MSDKQTTSDDLTERLRIVHDVIRKARRPFAPSRLLGCPFCGSPPESYQNPLICEAFQWMVECRRCMNALVRSNVSRKEAEREWNTRAYE